MKIVENEYANIVAFLIVFGAVAYALAFVAKEAGLQPQLKQIGKLLKSLPRPVMMILILYLF